MANGGLNGMSDGPFYRRVGYSQRLRVTVSGIEMPVQQITQVSPGVYMVQITITQSFGGAQVPVVAAVDGSQSAPFQVTIR